MFCVFAIKISSQFCDFTPQPISRLFQTHSVLIRFLLIHLYLLAKATTENNKQNKTQDCSFWNATTNNFSTDWHLFLTVFLFCFVLFWHLPHSWSITHIHVLYLPLTTPYFLQFIKMASIVKASADFSVACCQHLAKVTKVP